MRALIGSTGFVGGNLAAQSHFDALFHSTNIGDIEGRAFDEIVCAGAPAAKWKANADPAGDRANIDRLIASLDRATAKRLVLISTVDVFPEPVKVDERSRIDTNTQHPYGRHRHVLEQFVRHRFHATILRLPGLFGPGLRKNILYDLLHGNQIEKIHQDGIFQFYDLNHLTRDIGRVLAAGIPLFHMATEPVTVLEVACQAFGIPEFDNGLTTLPPHYDMRTIHARLWNRQGHYLRTKAEVLGEIAAFVRARRKAAETARPAS
jgi:nucleoside-diphosphate-sugar epimerase